MVSGIWGFIQLDLGGSKWKKNDGSQKPGNNFINGGGGGDGGCVWRGVLQKNSFFFNKSTLEEFGWLISQPFQY
jgi:hypothetical protein